MVLLVNYLEMVMVKKYLNLAKSKIKIYFSFVMKNNVEIHHSLEVKQMTCEVNTMGENSSFMLCALS